MQDKPVAYWSQYDTELFDGKFTSQIFPWHFHKEYTVIAIDDGEVNYVFQDTSVRVGKGEVLVIDPYDAHYNHASGPSGWTYKVFFLPRYLFSSNDHRQLRTFNRTVSGNKALYRGLLNCHKSLEKPVSQAEYTCIMDRIRELLTAHIHSQLKSNSADTRIIPALSHIEANLSDKISNAELAALCNISKFHFQRLFKACTGLTVRDYINQQRMEASRGLLREGAKVNTVAYTTGYFDQSHFHHQFKKMYGLTPKNFSQ